MPLVSAGLSACATALVPALQAAIAHFLADKDEELWRTTTTCQAWIGSTISLVLSRGDKFVSITAGDSPVFELEEAPRSTRSTKRCPRFRTSEMLFRVQTHGSVCWESWCTQESQKQAQYRKARVLLSESRCRRRCHMRSTCSSSTRCGNCFGGTSPRCTVGDTWLRQTGLMCSSGVARVPFRRAASRKFLLTHRELLRSVCMGRGNQTTSRWRGFPIRTRRSQQVLSPIRTYRWERVLRSRRSQHLLRPAGAVLQLCQRQQVLPPAASTVLQSCHPDFFGLIIAENYFQLKLST